MIVSLQQNNYEKKFWIPSACDTGPISPGALCRAVWGMSGRELWPGLMGKESWWRGPTVLRCQPFSQGAAQATIHCLLPAEFLFILEGETYAVFGPEWPRKSWCSRPSLSAGLPPRSGRLGFRQQGLSCVCSRGDLRSLLPVGFPFATQPSVCYSW